MILRLKEDITSDFEGTVIDIETIGEFLNQYSDSRRYKDIQLVILGFVNRHALHIFCAKGTEAINELKEKTGKIIDSLERPFYAFNSEFESGVWFHQLDKKIIFDGELQKEKYEKKSDAIRNLGIPNYDDPFYDNGLLCKEAWESGQFTKAMAHNRACLLKERDLLLKRGFRTPNKLNFNK